MTSGINLNTNSLRFRFQVASNLGDPSSQLFKTSSKNMALNQDALNALRIERSDGPAPPPGLRTRIILIVAGVVVIAALGAWWLNANRAAEVETIEVTATRGTGNNAASVLDASGYVVARRIATVSAKMMGQVEQVLIEEGDRVKAGQVLARLDGSTVRKQFELSRQQLEATRAQLAEVKIRLADAQRATKRAEQLRAEKLISEAESDTVQTNASALQAQLEAVQHQVSVSEASLKVQQQNVADLEVRAPFDGVILSKAAQPGEIISPMSAGGFTRTGIATIVDMDSREIEVDVNESFIHRVTQNQKTEAVLDAYSDWSIPSHVVNIVPTADRAKATVKVRISFDKLDPRILPDMGVKVRFMDNRNESSSSSTALIELPTSAIVNETNHRYVWRINNDRIERVAVSTGVERNDRIQVLAGIQSGDHVVNHPASTLQDGMKVKAKN